MITDLDRIIVTLIWVNNHAPFSYLKIEKFNEKSKDYFVATSDNIPGLVAEADVIEEVLEIAADLVPLLLELNKKRGNLIKFLKQAQVDIDNFLGI